MLLLRILFFALPIMMFVLGVPLAMKLVPPNRFYGFRTPTTFSSLTAWYQINFATGLALIAAGAVSGAFVFLLSRGMVALKPETCYLIGVLFTAIVTLMFLLMVVIYSDRF